MSSLPTPVTEHDSPALPAQHQTGLITLLFTDLVGSTALKQQVGDRTGARLIQQHHALVRDVLRGFNGGEEIETAGDSFLLVFTKPSDAVHFALLLHARLRALNQQGAARLEDRIGIHVGEVVIREQDGSPNPKGLTGSQVDTCARVMGLAQAGQTLMTRSAFDSARQMLKGEDIEGVGQLEWLNHGSYLLKGIEASVEICEARELGQETPAPPTTSERAQRQVPAGEEPVLGWRPAVGQLVPNTKWALEQKLGEGGFGEVWLGRHQTMKELRVFKFCFQAERVRFLKRELTLFRVLKERIGDHPNIVRLHEVYLDHAPFYVEMDYVEGSDLRTWCEQHGGVEKVPPEVKLEIVAQVADGLQAAHDAGVIHRDVKPGNILVQRSSRREEAHSFVEHDAHKMSAPPHVGGYEVLAKLTDFGIGQVVSEECLSGITRAGFTQTMMSDSSSSHTGTQMYMAPELLAGKSASTRSDIYSLGVVLYQLLLGDFTRPVTTDWARDLADPLLCEDLKLCFAGHPADRFPGSAQLAKHLRALPARRAELAAREAELAARERAAHRRGVIRTAALAACIVAAMTSLAAYSLHQSRQARELAHRRRLESYAAEMNLAQQALAMANLGRAQELLNRQRPVAGERDLRGFEWRYLWQQCQSDALLTLGQKSDAIKSLAVSADGRLLTAGGEFKGMLSILDWQTRQERAWLKSENTVLVAFSPREPLLAFSVLTGFGTTNEQNSVRLWNASTEQTLTELPLADECGGLAFSGDGKTLVTSSALPNSQITLWRMPSGARLATYPGLQSRKLHIEISFAVARDLHVAAQGTPRGGIRLIDLTTGRERWSAKAADEAVTVLALSPDGRILASGAGPVESAIRLWDVATGKEIKRLEGHRAWVSSLVFWPDGKTLASASADQTIRLWDISDPAQVPPPRLLRGHKLEVWSLALLPDNRTLASGSKDGSLYLWDTTVIRHDRQQAVLPQPITAWRFAADSKSALTVDRQGRVARWHGDNFQERQALVEIGTNYSGVCLSGEGDLLAAGWTNGVVQVWDLKQRALRRQLSAHANEAFPYQFLSEGRKLVIFHPDDRTIHVWDLTASRETESWSLPAGRADIAFSRDERWSLALGFQRPSLLRDMRTGRQTNQNLNLTAGSTAAFSPDGKLFAAANNFGYARLWETGTLREAGTLHGFLLGVHSVAFSPDARRLATGSDGQEAIKLWDLESHREVLTLEGQGSMFRRTAFSPDGNVLGSVNVQGVLHLWRAPSWSEIEAAEQPQTK